MAGASVTFLLGNLKDLIVNHFDLIKNAKSELENLEKELEIMTAALEDSSTKPNKNKVFEEWERKIEDVIYEVEDVIDLWVTEAATKNSVHRFASTRLAQQVRALRIEKVTPLVTEIKHVFINHVRANSSNLSLHSNGALI